MLNYESPPSDALLVLGDSERTLYEGIVPETYFLRRLSQVVDFESFRPSLTSAYSPDQGRRPLDPVVLLSWRSWHGISTIPTAKSSLRHAFTSPIDCF
jgi:hypothetical protein